MRRMVSNREKGRIAEAFAEKAMQSAGWLTYRVKGSTRFNRNVDIFSLYDLLCIHAGNAANPPSRKWIQVKNNKKLYGKQIEPFRAFRRDYCDGNDSVEIWTWRGRKGWEKRIIEAR